MIKPDLSLLAKWLDTDIVEALDRKRRLQEGVAPQSQTGDFGDPLADAGRFLGHCPVKPS